ncbi:hypothetical protein WL99_37075 [Burkholderia cepacia]|nr:hypothetical protein WK01_17570 [Burkholderia cepacia]KWA04597.1 hypothetical protein WL26_01545 [Burkholderia cepacia]KWH36680.1 hypothetical protein WL99_37075 [Burkholderia cepacia]
MQGVYNSQYVVSFAFALAMLAGRTTNATEIGSNCEPVSSAKSHREYAWNLVLRIAALQWVRMCDHDDATQFTSWRVYENLNRASGSVKVRSRCFQEMVVHDSTRRTLWHL